MAELLELTRGTAGVLSMSTGDEGDGRSTVFLTAPDGTTRKRRCSYEEFDSLMGTLEREGEPGVAAFFSDSEPVTLSDLEHQVADLAEERVLERINRHAEQEGLTFGDAARDLSAKGVDLYGGRSTTGERTADLSGGSERPTEPELDHAAVEARAERDSLSYVEAARAMAAEWGA